MSDTTQREWGFYLDDMIGFAVPNRKTEIKLNESLAAPLIAAAFSTMQEDLDKERKAIIKQWAKREEQIERVMGATVGMYGDLQGLWESRCRRLRG